MSESDGDPQIRLSVAERWASYVAAHASGVAWAIVFLCIGAVFFALLRDWLILLVFGLVALVYWERGGFSRLLARRDAEIARMRARGDAA